MFSRPFNTIDKITIEAADCIINHSQIDGQLYISIEPRIPVPTAPRNANPLLSQSSIHTPNSTPQTTSPTLQNAHSTPTPSTSQDTSVTYTYKTDLDCEDHSPNVTSNDMNPNEFLAAPDGEDHSSNVTSNDMNPIEFLAAPDGEDHSSNVTSNYMNPNEFLAAPDDAENTINPLIEDQCEAYASLTREESSSKEIGEMPEENSLTQNDEVNGRMPMQTGRKEENSSTKNDETPLKTSKQDSQVEHSRYEDISDNEDKNKDKPQDNDGLMPQEDNCLNIETSTSTQQDENQGAVDEELTIPQSLSPDTVDLVQSDTDEDCVLSRVSPPHCPKIKKEEITFQETENLKAKTASVESSLPPGVFPKVILKQFPYKAAGRNYTITITETPRKRHSPRPDSPQASTSTATKKESRKKKMHHKQ